MPIPQNAQLIWNYLVSHGFSANAAAGILGNIEQESGGNPAAGVWPSNYGLIQWTPASRYFSGPPSLQAQLPAIIGYIQENGSIADVNAHATSPSAAALYFSEKYERPLASEANNENRMNSANEVFQAAQTGHWPGGTPSPPPKTGNPFIPLAVDGSFGPLTTKALQWRLGVATDGIFGSLTKLALQRHLGVTADGDIGPITIKALQRHVGVAQDGIWGPLTTEGLQRSLNANRF